MKDLLGFCIYAVIVIVRCTIVHKLALRTETNDDNPVKIRSVAGRLTQNGRCDPVMHTKKAQNGKWHFALLIKLAHQRPDSRIILKLHANYRAS